MFGPRNSSRPAVAWVGITAAIVLSGSAPVHAELVVMTEEVTICATAQNARQDALPLVLASCDKVVPLAEGANLGRLLRYRGWARVRSGMAQQAIPDFDRALAILGNDRWSLQGRALANRAVGNLPDARRDYEQLLAFDPSFRGELAELGVSVPPPPSGQSYAKPPAGTAPTDTVQQVELPPPAAAPTTGPRPLTREATGSASLPAGSPQALAATTPTAPDPAELVRRLQGAMRDLGLYDGPINGTLGPQTRATLDAYARSTGLVVGAEPSEAILAAAELAARQRREQASHEQQERNRRAQTALLELGYQVGDIDGVIGPRSREALNDWLRKQRRSPFAGEIDEAMVVALNEAAATRVTAALAEPPAPEPVNESRSTGPDLASPPTQSPSIAPQSVETQAPKPPTAVVPGTGAEAVVSALEPELPRHARIVPASGERRIALVIGNSNYRYVTPLRNPRQDAEDMTAALQEIGFEVLAGYDLDGDALDDLTARFAREADGADLALTYYSGHALQYAGKNLLVPVDGRLEDRYSLRSLIELDQLVQDTGGARKLAVIIVDACRDDPLAGRQTAMGGTRSLAVSKGLAQPGFIPPRTVISYATSPGMVAYDGNGRNSPYVAALLRHIKTPGVKVQDMFAAVTGDVAKETEEAQRPSIYNTLDAEAVYLVPGAPEPTGLELAQMTRGEVRAIELSLGWLGFWSGDADGEVSEALVQAVSRWQGSQLANATGQMSTAEVVALHRRAARSRPREPLPTIDDVNQLLLEAAEGNAQAQRLLGMVNDPSFEPGGLPKQQKSARFWYGRAATAGDPVAAARLGLMLAGSGGAPEDRTEARRWLDLAAKAGDPSAALRLAELILDDGRDGPQQAQAVQLLRLAAAKPDTEGFANAILRDLGQQVVLSSSL